MGGPAWNRASEINGWVFPIGFCSVRPADDVLATFGPWTKQANLCDVPPVGICESSHFQLLFLGKGTPVTFQVLQAIGRRQDVPEAQWRISKYYIDYASHGPYSSRYKFSPDMYMFLPDIVFSCSL